MERSSHKLAAAITWAASKQTYLTIRFLVDRERVSDAFGAYAYFRWLDDELDRDGIQPAERLALVARQQGLMDALYHAQPVPTDLAPQERLLEELVRGDHEKNSGLQCYIRNMMAVMVFDARRRNRSISARELSDYANSLALAVTEAMHYFIGHGDAAPVGRVRYLAVTAAHITHMLRDTLEDVPAGYFNVPGEFLAGHKLAAADVESPAYRGWVQERVRLARAYFKAGRANLAQVPSLRCRLAGYAYTARFESVLDAIERDGYRLRASYPECKCVHVGAQMLLWAFWQALASMRPALAVRRLPES